ncbi:MAG TPA: hypothetical protein PKY35_08675 [Candidatus Hydrogenedentes bacterium]|nr:hypothetical protein [Candidatus Hydrogenedentota bacterium]HOL77090.1 hypothetical protein [Candidatus Hydrogenedentota bacterium]HPO87158.1 hypothetical protein [Candidatus Hydrogenedentota bacterium]
MEKKAMQSVCSSCQTLSRRRFLATGCSACLAGASLLTAPKSVYAQARRDEFLRLRLIYVLHAEVQPIADWPNIGFDFRPVIEQIEKKLKHAFPKYEFLSSRASNEEQTAKILAEDASANIDGYIVFQMNAWNRVIQPVAATGKPVLYADFLYAGSGGFLVYSADLVRKGTPNLGFIATSDLKDLVRAVKCFEAAKQSGAHEFGKLVAQTRIAATPKPSSRHAAPDALKTLSLKEWQERIRETKILAFQDENQRVAEPILGIAIEYLPFAELNDAWKAADRNEAKEIAQRWAENARKVADVSPETLEDSAAMYLAEKAVMKKHGANAITINCLGGFYGGHIHAYPCLGFFELNNQSLVGACECDIRSAVTMVAFTLLTQGRPGYISDPVMDTAKRQIIYAHCVASNKVFGPEGKSNPYEILTHSEDRKGASVRSIMPKGYLTTTLQIAPERKEILFHQAKAVGNDPEDRACRTKLCAEPIGDMEKLFTQWDRWGWHRVTFYGDLKPAVHELAETIGWTVVEEA